MSSGNFNPYGNAAAGSSFEVYPEALRKATDDICAARDKVATFALFGQAFETLGKLRGQAIAFVQGNTEFPDMPPMPGNSGIDDQRQWRVDPSAAPA
ncbi:MULTISPECIES: hypothetical protein [unclassified Amycolatopsis]|uniref:hypothetical protein n=1 Tax=unclassified Amycolatopsis TaxID=2618356 RepID=UPI00287559EE|nr:MULTISPECIES: hypothetical protein [unclassified Amycolatopsis]MDS0135931.1 hypothetical protein [Amycolatopsis sp. 505]MDS0145480.1 hypothetical protein [Amycolatopsis sp. CM201R]